MASIALTCQIEIFTLEVRVGGPYLLHEVQELVRSLFHGCQQWHTVRESCANWLVNIDYGAQVGPAFSGFVNSKY